jgi:hypothetical protein
MERRGILEERTIKKIDELYDVSPGTMPNIRKLPCTCGGRNNWTGTERQRERELDAYMYY